MRACPVCNEYQVTVLHHFTLALPDQFDLPSAFDVVECVSCGMVYNDSEIAKGALLDYYLASHYASTRPHRDDFSRYTRIADYLARNVSLDARVLEIGTAEGGLLKQLKDRGFDDCRGVNLTDDDPNGTFDLVIANQVLEHVLDVHGFIEAATSVLSPRGLIYIDVPNVHGYVMGAQQSFNFINFEHLNHFSIEHLDCVMGSEALNSGTSYPEIVPGYRSPMVYGLWRPGGATPTLNNSKKTMRLYLNHAWDQERDYVDRVLRKLNGRTHVIIRGYSHRAWHLLSLPEFQDLEIDAIIDSAPTNQELSYRGQFVQAPFDVSGAVVLPMADSRYILEQMEAEYPRCEVIW